MELNLKEFLSKSKVNIETESLPVRVWVKQRGLPSEIKSEKYSTTMKNSSGETITLVRNAIWGKMETAESYFKRKRHKSERWCKGTNKSSRRSFECKEIDGYIWIKLVSKWGSVQVKGRKMILDDSSIRLELKPDEIGLWYLAEDQQIKCFILPKFISLEKEFFELIGILDGEMCKRTKRKRNIVKISNAEPVIVQHILDNFQKYFNLQRGDWSASITVNAKNQKITKKYINEIEKFWSKKLGINKITKTTVNKTYISKFSPKGILQVRYSNNILWHVLIDIMEKIRPIILSNNEYTASYLRGLIAGEGGIGKDKKGRLRFVGIAGTKSEDKKFYMNCLDKIGIDSFKEYTLRVEAYGKQNFLKVYQLKLFDLHPPRKDSFIKALAKLKNINLS